MGEMLKRWTVTEEGKEPELFWHCGVAVHFAVERKKQGGQRVRFGWNLPTKKARSCSSEPAEMAELIENCGIREARKIMNAEM
jgi:hypothetical protein